MDDNPATDGRRIVFGPQDLPVINELHLRLPDQLTDTTSQLAKIVATLDQPEVQQQVSALAAQVKILTLQLQSINAEMSLAINGLRSSVAELAEAYGGHFHFIPAGLYTLREDDSSVPFLISSGQYQGKPGDGYTRLSLQGTSGPTSATPA